MLYPPLTIFPGWLSRSYRSILIMLCQYWWAVHILYIYIHLYIFHRLLSNLDSGFMIWTAGSRDPQDYTTVNIQVCVSVLLFHHGKCSDLYMFLSVCRDVKHVCFNVYTVYSIVYSAFYNMFTVRGIRVADREELLPCKPGICSRVRAVKVPSCLIPLEIYYWLLLFPYCKIGTYLLKTFSTDFIHASTLFLSGRMSID